MKQILTQYPNELPLHVKLGKCIVKIVDSIVNFAMLSIFLLFLLYGSYSLWQSNQVFLSADAREYAMYRPTAEDEGVSFSTLQQINPDVFAWLTVYGTNIDYPLTQTTDNERYVNTNVMGEYAISGNLFLDCRNASDFSDFNSIIYGHHMERKTMFGNIDQFINPDYFTSHQYGSLFFDGKEHGLELFAFIEADAYDYTIYRPNVPAGQEEAFLSNLFASSLHSRAIEVTATDHIVLLSTCTSNATNGRHILVGRITDEVFPDTHQTQAKNADSALQKSADRFRFQKLGNAVWMLAPPCILVILIILYVICERVRKRAHERKTDH